jgi:hypothetical protein
MRKRNLINFFYIFIIFILSACNDSVFYAISQEVKPIEPRIKGVPTNFALMDGRMYVAAGNTLYSYNDDKPYWKTETSPGGNILQLASLGGYLYALCSTDQNIDRQIVLRCFDKGNWRQIEVPFEFNKLQNIFSAGDALFLLATARNTTIIDVFYTIFYINLSNPITVNKFLFTNTDNDAGELSGAAYNNANGAYYLSTKNKGVYKINSFNEDAKLIKYQNSNNEEININFMGIINLEDKNNTVFLIARNGEAYTIDDSIKKIENVSMRKLATGSLAIYREPPLPGTAPSENPKMLLLSGRQDSLTFSSTYGYSYGYMELELDENGIKDGSNFIEPGINNFSTLTNNERYQSTIGKQPVNYILQVPYEIDKNMILFASTQKSGVWSFRERDNTFQWNAEGENEPKY